MKIVIAAWHLRDFNVGLGRYARGLIEALGRVDATNRYEIVMPTQSVEFPARENFRYRFIRVPLFKRRMWEQIAPNLIGRYDLLHLPYDSCLAWKRGKFLVTIHDVKPRLFGATKPTRNLNALIARAVIPDQRVQVDHVVTVSQWSKNDIVRHLRFRPDQISVVYPGVAAYFRPQNSVKEDRPKRPFVLSVAGSDPTKNVITLVEAFAELPPRLRETHDLLLAGDMRHRSDVHARVRELSLESQTSFPGVVMEEQLVGLYQRASVFVFPSRYEGFGLPVLEAMACGCPVISSTASSLPEVYGDAALSADPSDVAGFARHLERVLSDGDLRDDLRRKGVERAMRFSWDETAREMAKVYAEVGTR